MALSSAYSQMFADSFRLKYQAGGKLRNTIETLTGLNGDAYKLKNLAAVNMTSHGAYGADIPPKNIDAESPVLTFQNKELKLVIDRFEQMNMNASIINGYAQSHQKAIERMIDYLIINAIVTDATLSVAVGTTNLNIDKLTEARAKLGLNEVDSNLHIAIHVNNLQAMLKITEATSADYNTVKALVNGEINTFLGFTFHVLGNRIDDTGSNIGLPISGNNRTCIAWSESSTVLGFRETPMVQVVDVPNHKRVETISSFSAGAKVRDTNGVVTIICDESA